MKLVGWDESGALHKADLTFWLKRLGEYGPLLNIASPGIVGSPTGGLFPVPFSCALVKPLDSKPPITITITRVADWVHLFLSPVRCIMRTHNPVQSSPLCLSLIFSVQSTQSTKCILSQSSPVQKAFVRKTLVQILLGKPSIQVRTRDYR